MTYLYGLNPSGGVHRYDNATGQFEMFTMSPSSWGVPATQTCAWVSVDLDHYNGWIDWVAFDDLPTEARKFEGAQ